MGQKVNPIGLRLGVNRTWDSKWYVNPKEYVDVLHEDLRIKREIAKMPETKDGEISKVEIIRNPQSVTIHFFSSRPAVLVGAKGANIEKITSSLSKICSKKVRVKIDEITKPQANAVLVAKNIAKQLENRGSYKRALKKAVADAMKNGAQGIKIKVSGRLNGAEIARSDGIKEGRVPLHTLRSNIDYGFTYAHTSYGSIGIKVWIFNGESGVSSVKLHSDAGKVVKKAVNKAVLETSASDEN